MIETDAGAGVPRAIRVPGYKFVKIESEESEEEGGVGSIEKECDNCEYSRVVGDRYECDADTCTYRPMTQLTDGITECCGYDFGLDAFGESAERINYCPVCGKKIWK